MYFANRLTQPISILSKTIDSVIKENDLSLRVPVSQGGKDEVAQISGQLNKLLSAFSDILNNISQASGSIRNSSGQLSIAAKDTMEYTHQQQIETETLATSMNQMVASVNEIASNTENASSVAQSTDDLARTGSVSVNETQNMLQQLQDGLKGSTTVIHELSEDSDKISNILTVISEIAEQTNLLALNAAIEAARAGDQGRGFAVVADEVRTLAARTQDSTEQISGIIRGLQTRSSQAVTAIDENNHQAQSTFKKSEQALQALEVIAASSTRIRDLSMQVASAAEEQGLVANDINRSVVNIADTAQQSFRKAQEVDRASDVLEQLSEQLHQLSLQYRT